MPYSDKKKQLEAMRKINRNARERKNAVQKAFIAQIKNFPEFQQLSKEKQKKTELSIIHLLKALDIQIDAKMEEAEQYAKIKIEEIYQRKLKAILDLSLATVKKAEELTELIKKK